MALFPQPQRAPQDGSASINWFVLITYYLFHGIWMDKQQTDKITICSYSDVLSQKSEIRFQQDISLNNIISLGTPRTNYCREVSKICLSFKMKIVIDLLNLQRVSSPHKTEHSSNRLEDKCRHHFLYKTNHAGVQSPTFCSSSKNNVQLKAIFSIFESKYFIIWNDKFRRGSKQTCDTH